MKPRIIPVYPWNKEDTFGNKPLTEPDASLPVIGDYGRMELGKNKPAKRYKAAKLREWIANEIVKVDQTLREQDDRKAAKKYAAEKFTSGRMNEHRENFAPESMVNSGTFGLTPPPETPQAIRDHQAQREYTRTLPTPPKAEIPFGTCNMGFPHTGVMVRHREKGDDMDSTRSNTARTSKSVVNIERENARIEAYLKKKNPEGQVYGYCTSNMASRNFSTLPGGGIAAGGVHKMVASQLPGRGNTWGKTISMKM